MRLLPGKTKKAKQVEANISLKGTWSTQDFRNQDAESFQARTRPWAGIIPPSQFLSANFVGDVPIPEGSFSPGDQLIVNWDSPGLDDYCFKLVSLDFFFQSLPTQGVPTASAVPARTCYYPISGGDAQLRRGIPILISQTVINGGILAYVIAWQSRSTHSQQYIDGDLTPNLSMTVEVTPSAVLPTSVKLSFGATYIGWPINVRRVGAMWLPELYR